MRFSLRFSITTISCFLFASLAQAAIPAGYTGTPFSFDTLLGKPQQIPGDIKLVFFDNGGEGVAFHDNDVGNNGGSMRKNAANQQIQADLAVDMQNFQTCRDITENGVQEPIGSWFLAWTGSGEWLKYTVHVNTAGAYIVSFHMAESDSPNVVGLTFNDVAGDSVKNLHKSRQAANCGCGGCEPWHAWNIFPNVDTIVLDTGLQVFKLGLVQGNWNFDWVRFTLANGTGVLPHSAIEQKGEAVALQTFLANKMLNVSFNLPQAENVSFSIVDLKGKTLNSTTQLFSAGGQMHSLPVSSLSPGVYFLKFEHRGMAQESRFIITR
jgi:hypothetical protein